MRKLQYRFHLALLAGALLNGQASACEPPEGFVNPPRPEIAPFAQLVSHTEEMEIARAFSAVMQVPSRPLKDGMKPSSELPGVSGTFRLSDGPFGSVGSRRLVCLTDGSTAVEEVLAAERNDDSRRFMYVVWNYTSPKFRGVSYGVGEFRHTAPAPDKTRVQWTYRFALDTSKNPGRFGAFGRFIFRQFFLESEFAEMMRNALELGREHAEASIAPSASS